jgi:choice-of-anchor B domain-containing protein
MSNHSTRSSLSVSTLIGLALACAAGVPAYGDEDGQKLRDRKPAYNGPGFVGGQWVGGSAALGDGGGGGGVANAFDAKNITMKAWLPLNMFPGGNNSAADCWGYVSPGNREYAIIGLEKGYGFVEVTDPINPVIVGFISGPNSLWKDVTIVGQYAYCGSEGGSGIQIIDLQQIDSGTVTLVKNDVQNGHSSTHTILSDTESGFLYLCGSNLGGLVAVSTADPRDTAIVGQWNDGSYVHECLAVTWTEGAYAGHELVFCFNGGDGMEVIDVTNKANMVKIGGTGYPQVNFCHQGWLSEDRKYMYINDELDNINTTRVLDVSNPAAPVYVTAFNQTTPSIDHNLYTLNGKIYEANYTSGLRIFNMADPLKPVEVAFFDTHPEGNSPSFNGAWGNYPYLPSGNVLISDIERGLFIVKEEVGQLVFGFAQDLPEVINPGEATPIVTTITEDQITLDPNTVRLHVSINGGPFDALTMSPDGNGGFTANLPASECFDHVNFYLSAGATDGRTFNSPFGAPVETYAADVRTGTVVAFDDDMEEIIPGWTVANENLQTGAWVRVNPNGTGAQPEDDADANGTMCYVTGQGNPGGGIGDADVDGGPTRLLSPTLDLSASPEAAIEYTLWYYSDQGVDTFYTHISNNNGQSWTQVESIFGGAGGWQEKTFRVADFVTPTNQVRVRFSASDNPNDSITEAGLDDFRVVIHECVEDTCLPDLDGSGELDLFDFLAFNNLFNDEDPAADWDDNGVFDLFDFLGYVNAFNAGC